jgi:hypothetical protein
VEELAGLKLRVFAFLTAMDQKPGAVNPHAEPIGVFAKGNQTVGNALGPGRPIGRSTSTTAEHGTIR